MVGRITSNRCHIVPLLLRRAVWEAADRLVDAVDRMEREYAGETLAMPESEIMQYRPEFVSCVFHVGFLSVPESDEQISRLRNEVPEFTASPARSAFLAALGRMDVPPIDRVAARVGGHHGR